MVRFCENLKRTTNTNNALISIIRKVNSSRAFFVDIKNCHRNGTTQTVHHEI